MEHQNDRILSREDVMEMLDIGRSTYYELVKSGRLKSYTMSGRYKVPLSSVQQFIKNQMSKK